MKQKNLQDSPEILWLFPFTIPIDVAIIDWRLRERIKYAPVV